MPLMSEAALAVSFNPAHKTCIGSSYQLTCESHHYRRQYVSFEPSFISSQANKSEAKTKTIAWLLTLVLQLPSQV
jgi:hypothetical protein